MKRIFFLLVSVLILNPCIFGQFTLPPLPYTYDALEPYIDSETMNIHYNNHHATYVKNLNNAIASYPKLQQMTLEELIMDIDAIPSQIRTAVHNNGGGHYNHSLFWTLLSPAGTTEMSEKVKKEIERNFGTIDQFKSEFEKAATDRFGSGWAWLIKNAEGKLQITSTSNQDNPLMPSAEVKGTPILGLDVWEHAYYLKYQSKRSDYIKNFWNIVNWDTVQKRLFP